MLDILNKSEGRNTSSYEFSNLRYYRIGKMPKRDGLFHQKKRFIFHPFNNGIPKNALSAEKMRSFYPSFGTISGMNIALNIK